jgi:hypothetical protein
MSTDESSSQIPMPFRERYAELIDIIDEFCAAHLNDEYREVSHQLAADMCQDGSPILKGKARSWAAGIIWSLGRVNFLSDASFEPTMTQQEFSKGIGVSPATISAKSRDIWNGLELTPLDPDYTVASQLDRNPMVWMVEVDGFIMDLRSAPRELQVEAYEQGSIPYIPADRQFADQETA